MTTKHVTSNCDWWSLQAHASARSSTYHYDDFVATLRAQISRQISRTKKNEVFNGGYMLENMQMLLHEDHFPHRLQASEGGSEEMYFPLLTFHATSNVDKVRSIAKHGYLTPGELHPTAGYTLKMKNGQYHGEGVYSSPKFETSQWYTFLDRGAKVQLIVNWVLLGKTHYVSEDQPQVVTKNRQGYNCATGQMWSKTSVCANSDYDRGIQYSVNGVYGNGANTRLLPDLSVVVSGDSSRVIPLAIITLRPNWNVPKMKTYLRCVPNVASVAGTLHDLENREFNFDDAAEPVTMYRVCDDWHVVDLVDCEKSTLTQSSVDVLRHHLIVPLSTLARSPYAQHQLQNLYGALNGDEKRMLLHDRKHVHMHCAKEADEFENHARIHGRGAGGEQTLQSLRATLETITREERRSVVELVYLVLDHALDVESTAVKQLVEEYKVLLRVRRITIKLIFVGCDVDKALLAGLKYPLQTMQHYEALTHHVPSDKVWTDVIDALLEENESVDVGDRLCYYVPYPYGVVGEGFVTDLVYDPVWGDTEQSFERNTLYKGSEPLPALGVGSGTHYKVRYITREQVLATLHDDDDASYARAKKRVDSDLEERRVLRRRAGEQYARMIEKFAGSVVQLVCRFRTFAVCSASRIRQYHGAITILCESILSEMDEITREEALALLCDTAKLRRACHQIQRLLSDINVFAAVKFSGRWFERLMGMRFAKRIVKRVGIEFDDGATRDASAVLKTLTDLRGYRITTRRTAASEIEPWLIIIDSFDNDATIAAADAYERSDSADENVDVVPDRFPLTDDERMYWAYVFTRNPFLYIPSQPYALLTVAWIRSLELIFRATARPTEDDWHCCWSLAQRVQSAFSKDQEMPTVLSAIGGASSDALSEHLTESAGVQSLCRLLGFMLRDEAREHVSFRVGDQTYAALSFALLAECVTRGCRAHLRSENRTVNEIVRRTLGISANDQRKRTVGETTERWALRTGRFYRRRYTNCSPYALVAALGFLERWHVGQSKEQVFAAFINRQISMRRFLADHLPGSDGHTTQLALFLQGIRFNRARCRQGLQFSNPTRIIEHSEAEQRALIAHEQLARENADNRRQARLNYRRVQAQPYQTYHKRVKLFTHAEVDKLNHAPGQQMELLSESGLLKHHCCYIDCPQYLQCFATSKDRAPGSRTRHGIMRHLRHNHLLHTYVPSFHLEARVCAPGRTYEQFVCSMERRFQESSAYASLQNKEQYLRDAHAFHNGNNKPE